MITLWNQVKMLRLHNYKLMKIISKAPQTMINFLMKIPLEKQLRLQDVWRNTIQLGKGFANWKGIQKELQVLAMVKLYARLLVK